MAVVLGGMVGLERELSGKPAGLRTNILFVEAFGAAFLVTAVLVGLGRVEQTIFAMRRVVSVTLRATHNLSYEVVADLYASYGISVQSKSVLDHHHDRTYELRLIGPTKQFENAASELLRRPDVLSVQAE